MSTPSYMNRVAPTSSHCIQAKPLRRTRLGISSTGILLCLSILGIVPLAAAQDPPPSLAQFATDGDLNFAPILDYDTDSCYNVPAIGFDANNNIIVAQGLENLDTSLTGGCRDKADLDNTNAYSRQRCNSGWCAYMYDYYFEKDVKYQYSNVADNGHRHDWEHIIVWVEQSDNIPKYVSASKHSGWETHPRSDVLWDGTHPKMVFNKDGEETHNFRFANSNDDGYQENEYHTWRRPALVSWNGFPSGVREILSSHSFDHASFALRDDNFPNRLHDAQPILWDTGCRPDETKPAGQCDEVLFDFDVNKDENSPGTPRKTFMIVGDSMTQGREGDWTWRYRLWKWFQSQHLDMIRFVGPFTGTREPDVASAPIPPLTDTDPKPVEGAPRANGRYATTEAWDTNHYAIWGRQIAQDIPEIQAHVRYYQPDYILIMLGFNDLGWFVSDADGTLASMKRLIDEARAAKPNVRFAITNIPQRTYLGKANALLPQKTNDYNALITANVPKWSTAESRMELVKLLENYQCGPDACPAGSDGLHPNAKGDFQIASIFSKTLFDAYGIGKSPLSVPADADIPARAHPVPTNVVAVGSDVGVTVTWNAIFGVYGFDVRYRLKGFDWDLGNIASGRSSTGTTRFDTTWTEAGMEWEYQVRSSVGDDVKSDWSSSMVKAVATPKTPVRPLNIKVYPSGLSAIQVSWENPGAGANLFNVIVWDQDIPDSWIASHATRDLAYLYTDSLIPGHRYNVYVEAWNSYGGGIPGQGRSVYPGAGMTSTPLRLVVETIDPTTVMLSWVPVSFAVSYRVYVRRIDDGSAERIDGGDVTEATHGIWFLFPGVWHHEFCVTAMNGDLESGRSNCVIPPVLPGW